MTQMFQGQGGGHLTRLWAAGKFPVQFPGGTEIREPALPAAVRPGAGGGLG